MPHVPYHQLDLERVSPQLSGELSEMVCGTFFLSDYHTHEARVFRLHALLKLYNFVLTQGELEHTSDWDWRISICYGEPNAVGSWAGFQSGTDEKDYSDAVMCDTISLDYQTEPGDYTSQFQRWEFLTVEEFRGDDHDPVAVQIPIDHVRFLSIGYDT